jgi:hypothetical protein
MEALIGEVLPPAPRIGMPVMSGAADGSTATLDGLGDEWVPEHLVDGFTHPMCELDWKTRQDRGTAAIPSGCLVSIDIGARAAFGDLASSMIRLQTP